MELLKKCYIDCTGTINSGHNTGIERVVRNIITRSNFMKGYRNYLFVPVFAAGSDLYLFNDKFSKQFYFTCLANKILGKCFNIICRVFTLHRPAHKDLNTNNASTACSTCNTSNIFAPQFSVLVAVCRRVLSVVNKLPLFLDTLGSNKNIVHLQKGDILFLADSFWNVNSLNSAQMAKARGALIILLIYDIIPITHPIFFDQTTLLLFRDYLPRYMSFVDGVISISRFTMSEVVRHYGDNVPLDYSYLGADFPPPHLSQHTQPFRLSAECSFLMVGTIEPRKNHIFIVDAFERLWEAGSVMRLDIVGRVGWKSDHILERIKGSRFFNKHLFFHENIHDAELYVMIQKATAVILASIVEGFGLPLIEAMHMNKTVLASDIPVFREIGGDYPIYFPLDDAEALMGKITLVADGKNVKINRDKNWITWDESVQILFDKVINMAGRI